MYINSVFRLFEKKSREQYSGIYSVCINSPLAVPGCADRQLEQAGNHLN